MLPNPKFRGLPPEFWAHVRTLSQALGYTVRKTKRIRVVDAADLVEGMRKAGLSSDHLVLRGKPTVDGQQLIDYFAWRAQVLNDTVQDLLMDAVEARAVFLDHKKRLHRKCPLPMNKQKGKKRAEAYLTCLVNMILEDAVGEEAIDYAPKQLTTVTKNGKPVRTLARRIDGAFPSVVNPVAAWEIKEYYYTTTFGSRVADGVYETLLDGMELDELERVAHHKILHYLFIDSKYTWWVCGRSYLCRLIDVLHMGYVDEIIFGREVVTRLPKVVPSWLKLLEAVSEGG